MGDYPIEGLMNTAMNSIKEMIDVNTIIGEPIETSNNIVVIPVSKVNFGFAAGGSEFKGKVIKKITPKGEKEDNESDEKARMPFGGGSGAGVSINPIAFIVVQSTGVKLLPVEHSSSIDKLLDLIPDIVDKLGQFIDNKTNKIQKIKEVNFKYGNNGDSIKETTVARNGEKEQIEYDYEYDETDM